MPRLARAPAAWGGARKWNGLAGPPQGLPRVDTQHSRLSSARSADANHSRTSPENSTYGPAVAISAPIPRPSMVSPARAILIVMPASGHELAALRPGTGGGAATRDQLQESAATPGGQLPYPPDVTGWGAGAR